MNSHYMQYTIDSSGMKKFFKIIPIFFLLVHTVACPVLADDDFLSQEPMETKVKSAPPNVMFILDNSGSMDFEVMAPETEGKFDDKRNIFDISDNQYTEVLAGADKMAWRSQWSGYSTIFYNPHINYAAWPRWNSLSTTDDDNGDDPAFNADLVTPRSNPINESPTLNLHNNYFVNVWTQNPVVVDNSDGSPSYIETETNGDWDPSNSEPRWNDNARYLDTNDRGTATYTPNIPAAGNYTIWGFWNCYDNRDENALFQLDTDGDSISDQTQRVNQRADADDTPKEGYCGNWVPLFGGSAYTLPSGRNATVKISRDGSSTGNSTVADAIAFVPSSSTINVKNAHYYMVDDNDNDGEVDQGEAYLINFIWTDSNTSGTAGTIDEGELVRKYYQVYDYGTDGNHAIVSYVQEAYYNPVDQGNDNVPDSIQPRKTDEEGNPADFYTDREDLQNFANWFSFYRRRELASKAAIARTISSLEDVNIGYYTLHSWNGVRQEVMPITENESLTQIVVAGNSGTQYSTGWTSSSASYQYESSAYYTRTNDVWSSYSANQPAGEYTVSGWWPCYSDADQKAKITIVHSDGSDDVFVNQRATSPYTEGECVDSDNPTEGCCGGWVEIGTYNFPALETSDQPVTLSRTSDSTGDATYTNAFRFVSSSSVTVDNTDTLLSNLYSIDSSGGTPLRTALDNVGHYFDMDDGNNGNVGDCPYYSEEDGGACQQAFAIAMTDGYWNGTSPGVGNADSGKGSPYQDSYSNMLADVAMYYYDQDLSAALPDEMPVNNYDKNKQQHMVTFGISFGLDGSIDLDDVNGDGVTDDPTYLEQDDPYFLDSSTPHPVWPDLTDSTVCPGTECPGKIDDLWHAAVNGRGRYFSAKDPQSLVDSLKELFEDISSRGSSGASVSVNGDELSDGLVLYQSSFTSGKWKGNVTAYPINRRTGEILRENNDILWEAADELQTQSWDFGRKIITYDGSTGIPFRYANLSVTQQEALGAESDLVDYIRGREISGYRNRDQKLGDFVHSPPLLLSADRPKNDNIDNDYDGTVDETDEEGGTIFIGGNDGMLHALNAETGKERFAYIPLRAFDYLKDLSNSDFAHRYFVDGTASIKKITFFAGDQSNDRIDNDKDGCVDGSDCPVGVSEGDNGDNENYSDSIDNDGDGQVDERGEKKTISLLVGSLKKGGRGIYALDVSRVESIHGEDSSVSESDISDMVLWEYPPIGAAGLQYAYAGDQTGDEVDNDGDGCTDGSGCPAGVSESDDGDNENYGDLYDNDGDGLIDEQDEMWLTNVTSTSYAGDQTSDLVDNDNDGTVDEPDEDYGDGIDNDNDGTVDEEGEIAVQNANDDDMGYSFSDPFTVRSYKTFNEAYDAGNSPWVTIFGNGYKSRNGRAVLYVLDAITGSLVRKIDTGAGGQNGLSSPAIVDVDNDDRVDFVYAGDLKGNMWKFDLRDPNPANWGVAYGTDEENPTGYTRIDYIDVDVLGDHDEPQPLFSSPGQPITSAPDVMYHADKDGYMVVFGTGKFLGEVDRDDTAQQTVYGIWDFGTEANQYLGTWSSSTNTLSNQSGIQLLEQEEIHWGQYHGHWLRFISQNEPQWYLQCDDGVDNDSDGLIDRMDSDELCVPSSPAEYLTDARDNDRDGATDEAGEDIGHAGWFFDLPFKVESDEDGIDNDLDGVTDETGEMKLAGERVVKDMLIRDGRAIFLSFIPDDSPCSGGGRTIIHEVDANSGGRIGEPVFDVNDDGVIDEDDIITIVGGPLDDDDLPASGIMKDGLLHNPVIIEDPEEPREMKIFSSSAGTTEILWEKKQEIGLYYWRDY